DRRQALTAPYKVIAAVSSRAQDDFGVIELEESSFNDVKRQSRAVGAEQHHGLRSVLQLLAEERSHALPKVACSLGNKFKSSAGLFDKIRFGIGRSESQHAPC